jgi:serine/threonine-protein kinase
MHPCPSSEVLRQLLDGDLPEPTVTAVSDHVAGCRPCQAVLDKLCEETDLRGWRAPHGNAAETASAGPGLERLLERGRNLGGLPLPSGTDTPLPDGPPPFLGQPRQEGDLGVLGPYRVEEELGRGGMGIVLRGRDDALQRAVALKVLRPELADARSRARFVREARAAARVRHDHVVGVYAVADPPDGPPYLVMEYLAGPTLAALIRARQRLEPRQAAALCAEVADGLAAAHAAGLVHRDIKPANILLDALTGRAKITDFGLARAAAAPSDLTREGVLAGTPAYMSPEQARASDPPDPRSDVYSLGVTLYEALTGEVPFRGAPHMVLRQVLDEEPRPPRRLNDKVPRDLETVCLNALAKEPARRYQTARELADDLRRWLNGEPIRARPVGPVGRLGRWCRRRPVIAGLVAALAVAIAAGFAGVLWEWRRAEASAAEARANLAEADDHFREACKAVDSFYGRVYEEGLLARPVSPDLRRQLMREALGFYEHLPASRRHDPTLQAVEAKTSFRLGWIHSQLGEKEDARTAFRQAVSRYEPLLQADPDNHALARSLTHSHFHLAVAQKGLGQPADALHSWQQARALLEPLLERAPDDDARYYLSACHVNIGLLEAWNGDTDDALRSFQAAQPLLEQLATAGGDSGVKDRRCVDLLATYNSLGDLQADPAEALHWFERARTLGEALNARLHATDTQTVRHLAYAYQKSGVARAKLGQRAEALALLQRARTALANVSRVDTVKDWGPLDTIFQGCLGECILDLGVVQAEAGRREEARRSWEQARAVLERLPATGVMEKRFQECLARTCLRLGDLQRDAGKREQALPYWRQARGVWEKLLAEYPANRRLRRELDEVLARTGGDAGEAAR